MSPARLTRTLSTAEARREQIVAAAVSVFAVRGYFGTSTTEVAHAAGISQAYLYRLYPDKQALFIAVIDHCGQQLHTALTTALAEIGQVDPAQALSELSQAYRQLVSDVDMLRVLMHGNCAAAEPRIREAVRDCYAKQVHLVSGIPGISAEQVQHFFANALLANTLLTIDSPSIDAPWARTLGHDLI